MYGPGEGPAPGPRKDVPALRSRGPAAPQRGKTGDTFEALYVLAITTGLRWEGADLEQGTLRVGRSLTREKGRYLMGDTNTKKGCRRVNLTSRTVSVLNAHRKRQLEKRVRFAGRYEDRGMLLHPVRRHREPREPRQAVLQAAPEEARLLEIRFHDLWHTCATILLGRSVHPKLVQELLGTPR